LISRIKNKLEAIPLPIRTSISGGVLSFSRLVNGFLRSKYVALSMGTAGIGLLSQGSQLQLLGVTLGGLGMAPGLMNRLNTDEYKLKSEGGDRLLATAFTSQMIASFLLLAFGAIFISRLSASVMGSPNERLHCMIALAGIPFMVIATGYTQCIFLAQGHYTYFLKANLIANFLSLIAFFPLVKYFGIDGAFISLLVSSVCMAVFFTTLVSPLVSIRKLFSIGLDLPILRSLLRFCFVSLSTAAIQYAGLLFFRGALIKKMGPETNGLLQFPIAIVAYYSPFLTDMLWVRFYPQMTRELSREKGGVAARETLLKALTFILVLQTVMGLWILGLRDVIVRVTYSKSFLGASDLLAASIPGDLLYFIAFTFSVYFLAGNRLKVYFVAVSAYFIGVPLIGRLLIAHLGVWSYPVSYDFLNAVAVTVALGWFVRQTGMSAAVRNFITMFVLCAGALVAESWVTLHIPGYLNRLALPVVVGGVLAKIILKSRDTLFN
jgi:hypothetical protein